MAGRALKFTRDPTAANTVRKVEPGTIVVGNEQYSENIGLLTDTVITRWPELPVPQLDEEYLQPILRHSPELLLLGTGWRTVRPPRELVFALARRGVGLEVMDTPAACRTFNILVGEDRRPAAVLYLAAS